MPKNTISIVSKKEPRPAADFSTFLSHKMESIRLLEKGASVDNNSDTKLSPLIKDTFSSEHQTMLLQCLQDHTDGHDHQNNSIFWRSLNQVMQEAAKLQSELTGQERTADHFYKYAQLYDGLIGQPCLDHFMKKYLFFFAEEYAIDFSDQTLISIGCGTALVEKFMLDEMGMAYDKLYGIDLSEAMITEARKRIRADVGNVLTLDPSIQLWDLVYSGLNVFQYIDHRRLEEAIQKTAAIIKPGGYFIGDFITPDHIRWYPNVAYSKDKTMISLRTPQLIEEQGSVFQESEIINISFLGEEMEVSYAGKHKRFLPPVNRIRTYFEKAFGGVVDLYDAHSLEIISETADSCKSTRYVVVARKAG